VSGGTAPQCDASGQAAGQETCGLSVRHRRRRLPATFSTKRQRATKVPVSVGGGRAAWLGAACGRQAAGCHAVQASQGHVSFLVPKVHAPDVEPGRRGNAESHRALTEGDAIIPQESGSRSTPLTRCLAVEVRNTVLPMAIAWAKPVPGQAGCRPFQRFTEDTERDSRSVGGRPRCWLRSGGPELVQARDCLFLGHRGDLVVGQTHGVDQQAYELGWERVGVRCGRTA
jgi:hypothetical protein